MAFSEPPVGPLSSRPAEVMGVLHLSTEHHVLREIRLDRSRMRIGRRPYNDILLDDLTVSGEHALLQTAGSHVLIHDLNSRNGTLVNGVSVSRKMLEDGDLIEIGVYRLRYASTPEAAGPMMLERPVPRPLASVRARVEVVAGPDMGVSVWVDRPVVALDNRMGQLAAVALRGGRFGITHLEGPAVPIVNGAQIGLAMHVLAHHDLIELGGTIYRFVLEDPA